MRSVVVVHEYVYHSWVFAKERIQHRWPDAEIIDVGNDDERSLSAIVPDPGGVTRLVVLRAKAEAQDFAPFRSLKEVALDGTGDDEVDRTLTEAGVAVYRHLSEGFWGQSVSECALALTLGALRRIPQLSREMTTSMDPWDYNYRTGPNGPERGGQFSDDIRFTNGTIEGKRVRVAGMGNIGSRYASFAHALGADVAAYDPYVPEPSFHRAGARRIHYLSDLAQDAEIFAPMIPPSEKTIGVITAEVVDALPTGCIFVMVTRTRICDWEAVRRRVLADEIALAADVHDPEPVPLDDPILGRHNVVHTPHIAGRTRQAGDQWVDMLLDRFEPVSKT